MKKFEKFVFLSDYRLVTAKVRDPECFRAARIPSQPCCRAGERIIRLENESVTRARTENRSGRERSRYGLGAANPREKLARGPGQNSQTARERDYNFLVAELIALQGGRNEVGPLFCMLRAFERTNRSRRRRRR